LRVEEKGENKYSYRRCIESKQASSFLSHFVLVKCKVEKAIKIEEKERKKSYRKKFLLVVQSDYVNK